MSQGFAKGTPGATGAQGPAGTPGAGASGARLFELAPVASPRFLGRFSAGSGNIEELSPGQGASLIPPFFASGSRGLVLAPTGGVTGNFLRDDGSWQAVAAGAATGVTLAQQQVAGPLTVQGRFTLGTGTREDLAPGQVASLIGGGWGSGMQLLQAPTGGVQGRVLRDDGQWIQPSFVASGIALGQLGALSPFKVVGRFTAGSGTPEQLSGDQVASMIGKFAGTGLALVPTPTGGALGRMLRDDGQWTTPSFVASGVTFAQQGDLSPLRIVGRFTAGSGTQEQLTPPQVASMLPRFAATGTPGLVPQPTGATPSGMFLRDDGVWGSPTGLGNGQFALMAPSTIKARSGSTGVPEDLVPSAVATMLPLFNNVDKGLVPGSGGGVGNFLRADGSWAAPSVGGAVSGVTFAQIQDISAPRFVGRFQGSGSAQELSPLTAASMLPRMLGTGFGLVAVPTAGVANTFLRDDGTWVGVPSSVATGITNSQFALSPPLSVKGRFTLGTGTAEDLSAGQVASLVPPFFGSGARGVVLGPTGGVAGNYLRDDGSWQAITPGGGGPTMLAAGGPGAVQFNGGSGFAAASGLLFDVASGLYLRDPLSIPTGFVAFGATGVPDVGILRFGAEAYPNLITVRDSAGVNAALMQWNNDGLGAVTLGGNSAVRKRWQRAADEHRWLVGGSDKASLDQGQYALKSGMRFGLPQLAATGLDRLGGWTSSGFANAATGIFITGSGVGLDTQALSVASLTAPLFSTTRPGLVPTATSLGQFLKDDGTWATPAGGAATGISNAMQLPMPPFTLKGRSTLGSGVPEDLTRPQVASLMPLFSASGGSAGLVTPPTGGASGYFLRDDGTFVNLIPRKEQLIGDIGSGVGSGFVVGSATVDFTTDPYQSLNLFNRTQFTLTPPVLHRHVQLRMVVGASGMSPTFFGTAVKWSGGSGATPGWNTSSGSVNFANFFYDGTTMWGQAGPGFG